MTTPRWSDKAKPIEEFPEYIIEPDGTVYTIKNELRRSPSMTKNGAVKITLHRDGRPYTRSLALLVAQAHVYNDHNPEIFDTPIHLDNDPRNNSADNLAWRPRWFAVKYQRQYWNPEFRHSTTRIMDEQTGEVYDKIIDACQRYGFLYIDVLNSCTRGIHVFPSWRNFVFA